MHTINKSTFQMPEHKAQMESILKSILNSYESDTSDFFVNKSLLPSKQSVIAIVYKSMEIIFPGYFAHNNMDGQNLTHVMYKELVDLFDVIVSEIVKCLSHNKDSNNNDITDENEIYEESVKITLDFFQSIPSLRAVLMKDVEAAFQGDPAARSISEIILSYPGIFAVAAYRIAHFFYLNNVPLIARIITEYAHSKTGIDIHPGASIGEYFFIDHGTGVVIGETSRIGSYVKIYQGVTLGALSFPRDAVGNVIKGIKRHPKIDDNVTIYAGATILGGDTVIGFNSVIGGNVCIVSSIPPNSKVTLNYSEIKINITPKKIELKAMGSA